MKEKLFELQDLKYREFHSKLMPTVDKEKIIGIRVPVLRKMAKDMQGSIEAERFLEELPHEYYEENNLHAFLIEGIKDFDVALHETERFLPYVDNWATCDMFFPKVFKKNGEKLMEKIQAWIKSDRVYTVRYAIVLLMRMDFCKEKMDLVSEVKSEEHYINMAVAWYFATALTCNYEEAIVYLEKEKFSTWVHNKIIQKAIESFRIDKETKEILRGMKK